MAGGWTRDGAVQDQIDDSVKDAVSGARARLPAGPSAEYCDDCGAPLYPNAEGEPIHAELPEEPSESAPRHLH